MLSIKDVEHIADLARLKFSKTEKEKFSQQLSSILDYVNKLQELDTANIPPTAQVTGLKNIWRTDKPQDISSPERKNILQNAPESEENMYKVKRIL